MEVPLSNPGAELLDSVKKFDQEVHDKTMGDISLLLDHDTELLLMEESDMDLINDEVVTAMQVEGDSELLLQEEDDVRKGNALTFGHKNVSGKLANKLGDVKDNINGNKGPEDKRDDEKCVKTQSKVKRPYVHQFCSVLRQQLDIPQGWKKEVKQWKAGYPSVTFYSPIGQIFRSKKSLQTFLELSGLSYVEGLSIDDFDFCPFDAGKYCTKNESKIKKRKNLIHDDLEIVDEALEAKFQVMKTKLSNESTTIITRESLDECRKLKRKCYKICIDDLFSKQYQPLQDTISFNKIKPLVEIDELMKGEPANIEYDISTGMEEETAEENVMKMLVQSDVFLSEYCSRESVEAEEHPTKFVEQNFRDNEDAFKKFEDEDERDDMEEILSEAGSFLAIHGLIGK